MKKVFKIIEIVFIIGILGLFASCIISQLVAPESGYATWMGEHIWNIEKTRLLFSLVSQTAQRGESLSVAFSETAKRTGYREGIKE